MREPSDWALTKAADIILAELHHPSPALRRAFAAALEEAAQRERGELLIGLRREIADLHVIEDAYATDEGKAYPKLVREVLESVTKTVSARGPMLAPDSQRGAD